MPRPMSRGATVKPNDFSGSLKRLFKQLKQWHVFMIIALVLAMTSSILALVAPNKLSDVTDALTDGLTPNVEKFEEITQDVFAVFSDQDEMQEKMMTIMMDPSISDEEKQALQNLGQSSQEEMMKELAGLDEQVLEILLDDVTVDNVVISKADQIEMLGVLSTVDMNDQESILKSFDALPSSIYDLVKPNMNKQLITSICLFLFILYIISSAFSFIQNFILSTVSNRFAQKLRKDVSKKINTLPLKYFDTHENGDILSRITNDVDTIMQNLNNSLASLVSSVTLFIGCLIMMFYTNWIMAITAILSSLIGFILMMLILSRSQKYFTMKQKSLGELNGHIEEIYSGHTIVKAYNGEEEASKEFNRLNQSLYTSNQKSQFLSGMMPSLMNFVGNFGYLCVCVVGALLVLNDYISFGIIVAFMIYVRQFTSPLSQIAQAMSSLQSTVAASERVFEFLEEPSMSSESEVTKKLELSDIQGNIEFKHVNFGYDPSRTIINDFSLDAKAGQKIAIVGPTGAGKTTIVNLLMKFYEINRGDILIDGVSTKELTRANIHDLFTMVLQDTWLFEGTVRENVRFNNENASDEEIWEALKCTGADHYVKTLAGGLDAVIDDNDSISSGQKQLLTIARGMMKYTPFLILDEATSNVDTRTEELVQKAMDKLTVERTSFIIAHRLSTIRNADTILFMKDGNIVEQGSHDELIAKNGYYAELYNSQFAKMA